MKKVTVIHHPKISAYMGGAREVTGEVTTQTSWGSLAAAVGGMVGAVAPFVPPQYQLVGAALSAVLGALATKLP